MRQAPDGRGDRGRDGGRLALCRGSRDERARRVGVRLDEHVGLRYFADHAIPALGVSPARVSNLVGAELDRVADRELRRDDVDDRAVPPVEPEAPKPAGRCPIDLDDGRPVLRSRGVVPDRDGEQPAVQRREALREPSLALGFLGGSTSLRLGGLPPLGLLVEGLDFLRRAWLDPAGDRWEATLVGSGNMEGWTLFVRASAPVRPNKTEWKRGPDATWKELS